MVLQFLFYGLAEAQTYNKIEFVYNIEQMKGHLEQAVVNKENVNNTFSAATVFPNPASTTTSVRVKMEQAADVKIAMYDVTGRMIREFCFC